MSTSQSEKARRFRALHDAATVFVMPNPWDAGSARILTHMGFPALATSSSACAGTLGRRDGRVSRDEALAHARAIVDATNRPVAADLEKGFGDDPATVAELAQAGVRRISLAASLYRAAMAGLIGAAREVRTSGTFGYLDPLLTTAEFNQYMADTNPP